MEVKLGDYSYPKYLKELAKQRMEDSEYLSSAARQKLPSVKCGKDLIFTADHVFFSGLNSLIITMFVFVLFVQGSPQLPLKDEDVLSSISPPAAPGRDTDGSGHQEV